LDTDNLRGFLRANLPSYMIPAAFVELEAIPLTANGKIDKKALPAPGMSKLVNNENIAPRSQTEQILSKIWMDVLRTPRVSVQDSFFDAGGDSLLAIQTIARIQNKFEMSMPIQRIFEFPRLSDLAAQIDFILFLQEQGSGLQKSGNDRKEYIV
jgi:acyl carrier protein